VAGLLLVHLGLLVGFVPGASALIAVRSSCGLAVVLRRCAVFGLLLGHLGLLGLLVGFVPGASALFAGRPLGGGKVAVVLHIVGGGWSAVGVADIASLLCLFVAAVQASPFVFCAVDPAGVVVRVGFAHASCAGGGGGRHCGE
jgi:hypothetical protein